jgi:hypothetical protein
MTRMPPPDDHPDGPEHDLYDETPPRSIFAATWFRAVLVLIVLAVVGAIAVPYILDAMNPPTKPSVASRPTPAPMPPPAVTPTPPTTSPSTSAMSAQTDRAPDKAAPADRAPAEKAGTMPAAPRKPFGGDKTVMAEKSAPADRSMVSDKSVDTAKPAASDKPAPTDTSAAAEKKDAGMAAAGPKAEPKSAAATTRRAATSSATTASAPRATTSGEWWVQVGAFRDEKIAKKVAAKLREQNYTVDESVRGGGESTAKSADKPRPAASAPTPARADQYDVFVSGLSADELNTRLAAKGLTAEASGGGAVVKPSLALRDAVALSKELATDGLKVQVRRAGGAGPEPAPRVAEKQAASAMSGGEMLHRVRVGAFPDRATALSTLKELEAKGYKPFIARGGS